MKGAYPIILKDANESVLVFVPDFKIYTEGNGYAEAMEMARDAIGLMGIDMEDDGENIPNPSELNAVNPREPGEVVVLVDVDFGEYRKQNDMRAVRRNVSLPCWLNSAAEQAGINVSAVLQSALKKELGLEARA